MKRLNIVWGLIGLTVFVAVVVAIFIIGPESSQDQTPSTSYKGVEIVPDLSKDGIPPLTSPQYESGFDELNWLEDEDKVIGIEINGDARAYPLKIMSYHEIVNDKIGGEDLAITYSPICGSSVIYSREFNNQTFDFGNTGALYEGCTVMYDTASNSYWWQVTGQSIRGEFIDQNLSILPSRVMSWGQWKEQYPLTQVLSINTGYTRNYLEDPFSEYYKIDDIVAFPQSVRDDRMPAKTPIVGVQVGKQQKAYIVSDFKNKSVNDTFNNQDIKITGNESGDSIDVLFVDNSSESPAPVINAFWFAWYVAFPDTAVFEESGSD